MDRVAGLVPSAFDQHNVQNIADPIFTPSMTMWKYSIKIMNIVDLIAILPFYMELAGGGVGASFSIVRILRLARLFRAFKLGKVNRILKVLLRTVTKSIDTLGLLLFFILIAIVLFGAIIFMVERGSFVVDDNFPTGNFVRWNLIHSAKEQSPFQSILLSCYWAVVTTTTVGYGNAI